MTIRRNQTAADGGQQWLLISQLEHARISGELASAWHADAFATPAVREQIIEMVFHHDDGWLEWERSPGVDPAEGRPRTFTEMPHSLALPIWRKSIEVCETIGPLAALTVAAHFSHLLRQSETPSTPPATPAERCDELVAPNCDASQQASPAKLWLEEFDARRQGWFSAWQQQDPQRHTAQVAADALTLLQLWDRISLWLCCSDPTEAFEIEALHEPVTMIPISTGHARIRPWPLSIDVYRPSVEAVAVPVAFYPTAEALAAADHRAVCLRWELTPDPAKTPH